MRFGYSQNIRIETFSWGNYSTKNQLHQYVNCNLEIKIKSEFKWDWYFHWCLFSLFFMHKYCSLKKWESSSLGSVSSSSKFVKWQNCFQKINIATIMKFFNLLKRKFIFDVIWSILISEQKIVFLKLLPKDNWSPDYHQNFC